MVQEPGIQWIQEHYNKNNITMAKALQQLLDVRHQPVPIVELGDSQNVDGSLASAQSTAITTGTVVRIVSTSGAIRVARGENPTALATDIYIPEFGELWLPITLGHKVAVLGGIANITVAGS